MSHESLPATNHSPASSNGRPLAQQNDVHTVKSLSYLQAPESPALYRSIHSVKAQLDQTGTYAAKRQLLGGACEHLHAQASNRIAVEELQPELAAKVAADRFVATTPLAAPVETLEELGQRFQALEQLRRGQPSAHLSSLQEIVADAAKRQFEPIQSRLADAVAATPFAAQVWLSATEQHLDQLSYPEPADQGLVRFANILGRLQSLIRDPAALPDHKRPVIEQRLLYTGHAALLTALAEIATERTITAYRVCEATLRKNLHEWEAQVEACECHLTSLRERLYEEATRFQHRQARQTRAGFIVLEGPSEMLVVETLVRDMGCERMELVASFAGEWIQTLSHLSSEKLGRELADRPGELLPCIDPATSLSIFHQLVDNRLARVSIYAAVRAAGVEQFAEALFRKAEPLVQLERQNVAMGLEFVDASVLSAPPPQGQQDGQTFAQLKNALVQHGSVHVRIVDNHRAEFRLTRTLAGFPAAVQSINGALMWGYVESRKHHHFPHLMGLVRDSPDGRASEAAVEIIETQKRRKGANHG